MKCETDTIGRPQTLICTKTRRTFQRQCEQHRADCASMNVLLERMSPVPAEFAGLAGRLAAARERTPRSWTMSVLRETKPAPGTHEPHGPRP